MIADESRWLRVHLFLDGSYTALHQSTLDAVRNQAFESLNRILPMVYTDLTALSYWKS